MDVLLLVALFVLIIAATAEVVPQAFISMVWVCVAVLLLVFIYRYAT